MTLTSTQYFLEKDLIYFQNLYNYFQVKNEMLTVRLVMWILNSSVFPKYICQSFLG